MEHFMHNCDILVHSGKSVYRCRLNPRVARIKYLSMFWFRTPLGEHFHTVARGLRCEIIQWQNTEARQLAQGGTSRTATMPSHEKGPCCRRGQHCEVGTRWPIMPQRISAPFGESACDCCLDRLFGYDPCLSLCDWLAVHHLPTLPTFVI